MSHETQPFGAFAMPVEGPVNTIRQAASSTERPLPLTGVEGPHGPPARSFDRAFWVKVGILTFLVALAFWPNLRRLWLKTRPFYGEPNWAHAFTVPLIGLWYLYTKRDDLLATEVKPGWAGLGILLGGLVVWAYGIYPGQNHFVSDFGIIVSLFGLVTLLCGWRVMRVAWFPILFLVCALPWPEQLYEKVAWPLQLLAAKVAVHALQLTGVDAGHNGSTKISMITGDGTIRTLNVAEACAGMRSLMTFVTVGAAVAFLSARPLWQKLIVTASAVPIAIACNVMRVSGQGILDRYVSQKVSEGFAHQFVGLVMMVPAFLLILLVGYVLDNLFIEEAPTRSTGAPKLIARKPQAPKPQASPAVPTVVAATPTVMSSSARRPAVVGGVVPPPPSVSLRNRPANAPLRRRPPGGNAGNGEAR
jgi:exosortase